MKKLIAGLLIILLVFQTACSQEISVTKGASFYKGNGVTITDKGNYFDVSLDFTKGLSRKEIGREFARGILSVVPDYEALVDSYIAENLFNSEYREAFWRVDDLKTQIDKEYREEIEGMSEVFSGGDENVRGDNKISKDEFYMFNLFLDVIRSTQCSFVSVFGSKSTTGKTITGRILDWYGGNKNQLPRIQAVITMKNAKGSICSIGYMGFMGIITGFNDKKIFAAVQESTSGAAYSSAGKRSYPLDLRYALENTDKMEKTIDFMKDESKQYAVNHLIVFSDSDESKVLENNFSGRGTGTERVRRAVRTDESRLNKGVEWGIKDAVASVNSFILEGSTDNHTRNKFNTRRWKYIKEQLSGGQSKFTPEDIKKIMTYTKGSPRALLDTRYLYTKATLSMTVFQPDTFSLEVYFFPRNTLEMPDKPVFEKISVFQ
ncbi:C45 family autoproteolytic acyltransferase/hydolase [Ruminiclostridium josui]|uniref:C45 family autoproteolytic acyltransferase/hydolase n=1 Tax=Ruminiclostridium josui TaxID=1499 RepID=UPI0004665B68|nr:C45 family peptidase [Ruminiclostridium josui]